MTQELEDAGYSSIEFESEDEKELKVRLDKWLWAARFFKTRPLARLAVERGLVSYNGQRTKPTREIQIGAIVSLQQGGCEKKVIITGLSTRRRSADEAFKLFEEMEEQPEVFSNNPAHHYMREEQTEGFYNPGYNNNNSNDYRRPKKNFYNKRNNNHYDSNYNSYNNNNNDNYMNNNRNDFGGREFNSSEYPPRQTFNKNSNPKVYRVNQNNNNSRFYNKGQQQQQQQQQFVNSSNKRHVRFLRRPFGKNERTHEESDEPIILNIDDNEK